MATYRGGSEEQVPPFLKKHPMHKQVLRPAEEESVVRLNEGLVVMSTEVTLKHRDHVHDATEGPRIVERFRTAPELLSSLGAVVTDAICPGVDCAKTSDDAEILCPREATSAGKVYRGEVQPRQFRVREPNKLLPLHHGGLPGKWSLSKPSRCGCVL